MEQEPTDADSDGNERKIGGAWLVATFAFVCLIAAIAALEWVNRRTIAENFDRPIGGMNRAPVRELATAEGWTAFGDLRRASEIKVSIGTRWPDSAVAPYALWTAALDCKLTDPQKAIELVRKAAAVAQPGTQYFAIAYSSLARWLNEIEKPDQAMEALKDGLGRAATTNEKARLLGQLSDLVAESEGPQKALELLRDRIRKEPELADADTVISARAELQEKLGNTDDAIRFWRRLNSETTKPGYRESATRALQRLGEAERSDDH